MISEIEVSEPDLKTGTLNLLSSQALLAIRYVQCDHGHITWSLYTLYSNCCDGQDSHLTPVSLRLSKDASF